MTKLNARTRYAILAALDLAEHYAPDTPVKVSEVAARTGAPANYLVHILLALKRRALVNSTRGAAGGYWLVRRPEVISVGEVVEAVQPKRRARPDGAEDGPYGAAVARLWKQLAQVEQEHLSQVSLAALLRSSQG